MCRWFTRRRSGWASFVFLANLIYFRFIVPCGNLNRIEPADEGYFVSSCSPTSAFLERVLEEDGEGNKVLEGLTEDSNPVLVLFGFE